MKYVNYSLLLILSLISLNRFSYTSSEPSAPKPVLCNLIVINYCSEIRPRPSFYLDVSPDMSIANLKIEISKRINLSVDNFILKFKNIDGNYFDDKKNDEAPIKKYCYTFENGLAGTVKIVPK